MAVKILTGDCRAILPTLPEKSVHCCVTSPPYWGLRDYGVDGQIGLESSPEEFIAEMVNVFREVRRVLRDDGTLWLNLGDTYAGCRGQASRGGPPSDSSSLKGNGHRGGGPKLSGMTTVSRRRDNAVIPRSDVSVQGLKPKDLVGIPWRVALALQADGWYLRQDIIWSKPNPMPESVRDRCTKSHEYLFLLTKSEKYYYDAESISEPVANSTVERLAQSTLNKQKGSPRVPGKTNGNMKAALPRFGGNKYGDDSTEQTRTKSGNTYKDDRGRRNKRSVWTVSTQSCSSAHFATFPEKLIEPCIRAGCPEGGVVIDPFGGSGTTGRVAVQNRRNAILIELNPEYVGFQQQRTSNVQIRVF